MIPLDDIAMAGLAALLEELPADARVFILIEGPPCSCGTRHLAGAASHNLSPIDAGAMLQNALAHLPSGA